MPLNWENASRRFDACSRGRLSFIMGSVGNIILSRAFAQPLARAFAPLVLRGGSGAKQDFGLACAVLGEVDVAVRSLENTAGSVGGKATEASALSDSPRDAIATTALLAAALGLHLVWIELGFSGLLAPKGPTALVYGISAGSLALVMIALSFAHRMRALIRTVLVRVASAALLAASSAGVFAVFQSAVPLPLVVASGVFSGVSSALYYASLAAEIAHAKPAQALAASVGAYVFSTAFSLFIKSVWGGAGIVLAAALPIASLACLLLHGIAGSRSTTSGHTLASGGSSAGTSTGPDASSLEPSTAQAPAKGAGFLAAHGSLLRFALFVGGISFVNELVRTTNMTVQGSLSIGPNIGSYLLEATLVAVGIALISAAFKRDKDGRSVVASYRGTLFFTVLALLLPLTSADPALTTAIFFTFHLAVYSCFAYFWWLVVVRIMNAAGPDRGLRTFLWSFTCQTLASLAGIAGGEVALATFEVHTVVTIVLMVAVVILLLAYLALLPEALLIQLVKPAEAKEGGSFVEACRAVTERFGLSKREDEIMVMLAKGRDAAYICEQLVISKSTVSMHRQHIYRKLDIHSQQELIDLIDETKRELRA